MLSDNTIKAKYSVLAGPALGFGVRGWVRGSRPGQSDHFENKDGRIVHSDAIWNKGFGTTATIWKQGRACNLTLFKNYL